MCAKRLASACCFESLFERPSKRLRIEVDPLLSSGSQFALPVQPQFEVGPFWAQQDFGNELNSLNPEPQVAQVSLHAWAVSHPSVSLALRGVSSTLCEDDTEDTADSSSDSSHGPAVAAAPAGTTSPADDGDSATSLWPSSSTAEGFSFGDRACLVPDLTAVANWDAISCLLALAQG